MDSITYQINHSWVILARWCGYLLALFAVAYLGGFLFDPEEIPLGLAAIGIVLFGGLAFMSIRVGHSSEIYSIDISNEGVRQTSSNTWIPWANIIRLRERPILHRVDLIGIDGPTGIALEYQLECFPDALGKVLDRVQSERAQPSQSFRRSSSSWNQLFLIVATLGLSGLGAWVWYTEGGWTGPFLIVLMVGGLIYDRLSEISGVIITDGFVTVKRGLRTTQYSLESIISTTLALRPTGNGNQYLDVFIEMKGEVISIRPGGVDPFELFNALQTAVTCAAD